MKNKMEAKDFVLLMVIPIILISIITYTNTNIGVTGFIPKLSIPQQEESRQSNVLGKYLIMPSFRVKTDYNVNEEYGNLKQTLQNAIAECKTQRNIETCLKRKANELQWNCEQNENADVLYDFIDKLKDCINLENQSVVCKFSLDQRNFDDEKDFEIKLTDEVRKVKAELIENNRVLAADYLNMEDLLYTGYNNKDEAGKNVDSVKIVINFNNRMPNVREAFTIDGTARIDLSKTFLFYKSASAIKFIDSAEEDSFRAPPPANNIIELPVTNGIRFCAQSNKQVYAYDSSDSQARMRNIVYKFAVTFPKPE